MMMVSEFERRLKKVSPPSKIKLILENDTFLSKNTERNFSVTDIQRHYTVMQNILTNKYLPFHSLAEQDGSVYHEQECVVSENVTVSTPVLPPTLLH